MQSASLPQSQITCYNNTWGSQIDVTFFNDVVLFRLSQQQCLGPVKKTFSEFYLIHVLCSLKIMYLYIGGMYKFNVQGRAKHFPFQNTRAVVLR